MKIINTVLAVISSFLCVTTSSASSLLSGSSFAEEARSQPETDLIEKTAQIRDRAVTWLLAQRTEEYGWPSGDTARVLIALVSALEDWPQKNDLEARLNVKQLEIEILEKFLRKDIDPVTPAKVAFFSLALNAVCKDAHNFHGHNLIASLEKHHEDADFPGYPETFGYSLTVLVTCLSGAHLHKRQSRHLVQIAREEITQSTALDTRAMALMALECIRHRKSSEALTRHMHDPLAAISSMQKPDGSFGNMHTTALAIQTLAASGDFELSWNRTAATMYLVSLQEPNGSFMNNIPATSECLIAASALLNNAGVLGLRKSRCSALRHHYRSQAAGTSAETSTSSHTMDNLVHRHSAGSNAQPSSSHDHLTYTFDANEPHRQPSEIEGNSIVKEQSNSQSSATINRREDGSFLSTVSPPSVSQQPPQQANLVSVKYWLWIGPDPLTADKHNLTVQVPVNSTFYNVMQRAAEMTRDFEFSSTVWPNGHYVHTISGHREQPVGYHYWLLYCLKSEPDPAAPPSTTFVAPAGVDDLRVQDGQIYLFWFKKI